SMPLLSGARFSLNDWCGDTLRRPYVNKKRHVVVLSFWATYCVPCRKEIPELMQFAKRHEKHPVKVVCVSIDKEGADIVRPHVRQEEYTLPVALDMYKRTARKYGVKVIPALVVIGPRGYVWHSSVGFDDKEDLGKKLERVLLMIRRGENAGRPDPG
ncbi:MAG: redoxin domain-containing protein, partial [Chitinivibrionales bacterium]|nr:redoxin domain-containing protein [Chitinivibrionales bacterium]MBD3394966.1 redoxin domain-containing protein [Chitinivibrionales bacterium]